MAGSRLFVSSLSIYKICPFPFLFQWLNLSPWLTLVKISLNIKGICYWDVGLNILGSVFRMLMERLLWYTETPIYLGVEYRVHLKNPLLWIEQSGWRWWYSGLSSLTMVFSFSSACRCSRQCLVCVLPAVALSKLYPTWDTAGSILFSYEGS